MLFGGLCWYNLFVKSVSFVLIVEKKCGGQGHDFGRILEGQEINFRIFWVMLSSIHPYLWEGIHSDNWRRLVTRI